MSVNYKYSTFNMFKEMAEYFTPVLKDSLFQEKGVLTPKEFVAAGDLLVSKCPTWKWAKGSKTVDFLPDDKQFLITKKVGFF
jgi:ubiquitin-like-conjugating enzyme ATG3